MQENKNNSNKDLEKIDQDINFHRIIIFLIIIAVVFFYLIMKDIDVEDAAQHWGPVGDFFWRHFKSYFCTLCILLAYIFSKTSN